MFHGMLQKLYTVLYIRFKIHYCRINSTGFYVIPKNIYYCNILFSNTPNFVKILNKPFSRDIDCFSLHNFPCILDYFLVTRDKINSIQSTSIFEFWLKGTADFPPIFFIFYFRRESGIWHELETFILMKKIAL